MTHYCQSCGTPNDENTQFCQNCGAPMNPPAEETAPVIPAAPMNSPNNSQNPNKKKKIIITTLIAVIAVELIVIIIFLIFGFAGGDQQDNQQETVAPTSEPTADVTEGANIKSIVGEYILTSWISENGDDYLKVFNGVHAMPYRLVISEDGSGDLYFIGNESTAALTYDAEKLTGRLTFGYDIPAMDVTLSADQDELICTGIYDSVNYTVKFRQAASSAPFDTNSVYSLTDWSKITDDNEDTDYLEYWTNRSYLTPYELTFDNPMTGVTKDYEGNTFTTLTVNPEDMTVKFKQGNYEGHGFITVNGDVITVYKLDFAITEVFEKQPVNHFSQLLGSKSSVEGTLTAFTGSLRENDTLTTIDYIEYIKQNDLKTPETIVINNDGTGQMIYDDGQVWCDFTYDESTMVCKIKYQGSNNTVNAYFTIRDNVVNLYQPYNRYSFTYVIG